MEPLYRLEYEVTVDDAVDVALRLAYRSQAFREQVRRNIWIAGVVAGATFLAVVFYSVAGQTPKSRAVWIGVASVFGILFGYLFKYFLRQEIRTQHRKVVAEHLLGAPAQGCQLELRPEGAWIRQFGVEMMFPWRQLAGIDDNAGDIELRFNPASTVVVRNRHFASPAERQKFLELTKRLADTSN